MSENKLTLGQVAVKGIKIVMEHGKSEWRLEELALKNGYNVDLVKVTMVEMLEAVEQFIDGAAAEAGGHE